MRIIAGTARGRKLLSPNNEGRDPKTGELRATRPTLDRVKEAMFSIIQNKIYNAQVLDVFAGTGSLGLEAASRGARTVTLVDAFAETYDLLVENIRNLGFNEKCRALHLDYREALRRLHQEGKVFDLIFIDPPYLNEMIPTAMALVAEFGLLSPQGTIITKIDSGETVFPGSDGLAVVLQRRYGNTTLVFYEFEMRDE